MDIRVLRNFIMVVQESGITAAAEMLRISQPALSRQMKDLEREVGATLFVRGNRGRAFVLTDEGRLLYRRAGEIVELADRVKAEISSADGIGGDVHIAAAQSAVMRLVGRAAVRVRRRHPNVRVRLHDDYGANIVERLNNGLADFGVLVQPIDMGRFDHLPLPGGDEMGVLMRPDDPLASNSAVRAEDLRGVPIIMPQGALERRDLSGWFGSEGAHLDIVGTMNLSYNASCFVQEGYGCALGFGGMVDESEGNDLCFRPLDPPMRAKLSIAWRSGASLSPAAAAFLETLRGVVAQEEDRRI